MTETNDTKVTARIAALDWTVIAAALDCEGWAVLPRLLSAAECYDTAALYPLEELFRSHVEMARHGFGRGEYRYFSYPLPPLVAGLRGALYARLAPVANRWHERIGRVERFPSDHANYLAQCHAAGQVRPTPLLLQYGPGDYNCLHRDLYGAEAFPLQVAVLLSAPGADFTGGEFVLTEQRPRMQSRAAVVPLGKGDAVIFAVNERAGRGQPRRLPGGHAPRGQRSPVGAAPYAGDNLSRRRLISSAGWTWRLWRLSHWFPPR